jgi:site-specific DNA-methyltransferase (adenine-specific)
VAGRCSLGKPASAPTERERGHVELVEGDAVKVLAAMPAAFVDAIISDPAYGVGMGPWDVRPTAEFFREGRRVLKPGGRLALIVDDRVVHLFIKMVETAGFNYQGLNYWVFAGGWGRGPNEPLVACMPIIIASLPGAKLVANLDAARIPWSSDRDREQARRANTLHGAERRVLGADLDRDTTYVPSPLGRVPTTVLATDPVFGHKSHLFEVPKVRDPQGHPAAKPVELMAHLLNICAPRGGRVLDPFAGGGATGVAAILTGRHGLLIESDPKFAELARGNLDAAQQGDYRLPERIDIVALASGGMTRRVTENTSENEALRCPPKRATLEPSDRLENSDGMAARLGISTRTLRRRVRDGEIPAVRNGRTVRFDAAAVLARLTQQGVANDVVLPGREKPDVGGASPADRSGQTETSPLSAGTRKPSRRAGGRGEDDRGAGGRGEVGPGDSGPAEKEEPSGGRPGPGPGGRDEVARLREAADTARVLLGPRGTQAGGNL